MNSKTKNNQRIRLLSNVNQLRLPLSPINPNISQQNTVIENNGQKFIVTLAPFSGAQSTNSPSTPLQIQKQLLERQSPKNFNIPTIHNNLITLGPLIQDVALSIPSTSSNVTDNSSLINNNLGLSVSNPNSNLETDTLTYNIDNQSSSNNDNIEFDESLKLLENDVESDEDDIESVADIDEHLKSKRKYFTF